MDKLELLLSTVKTNIKKDKIKRIVTAIKENPGIRLQDLSEKVRHDSAGLSRYIKMLREHGILHPREGINGQRSDGYKVILEDIG